MDYRIKGKCAFISAGAHGIGEATANRRNPARFDLIRSRMCV
jgi:hypothetical protein